MRLRVYTFEIPVCVLVLFKEDECENGMRTQSDEGWHPTSEHPDQSFFLRGLCKKRNDTHVFCCTHNSRLNHIDRRADGCRNKAGKERGREVRCEVVLHVRVFEKHALENIIARQLTCGHKHGS